MLLRDCRKEREDKREKEDVAQKTSCSWECAWNASEVNSDFCQVNNRNPSTHFD